VEIIAGTTAATMIMHTSKWCGASHHAVSVKSNLKSGAAAEAAAVLAAVCLVLLHTLVSITNLLSVLLLKE
tara:strand:+ start:806 stop:1018 length:213 start_codon:yes stop_codon:yes gene_type:complete